MAKENPTATPGGGSGIGRAIARVTGGITGKGGKNVSSIYKESVPPAQSSVKVIPGGSKPATTKSLSAIKQAEANRTSASNKKIENMKAAQNGNLESIKNGTLSWGNYK